MHGHANYSKNKRAIDALAEFSKKLNYNLAITFTLNEGPQTHEYIKYRMRGFNIALEKYLLGYNYRRKISKRNTGLYSTEGHTCNGHGHWLTNLLGLENMTKQELIDLLDEMNAIWDRVCTKRIGNEVIPAKGSLEVGNKCMKRLKKDRAKLLKEITVDDLAYNQDEWVGYLLKTACFDNKSDNWGFVQDELR